MMRTRTAAVVVGVVAYGWLFAGGSSRAADASQDRGAAETAAFRLFTERIEQYAAVRARHEVPLPSFDDPRRDPWSLHLSRHFLASAIRTSRRGAALGDVFTPPVAAAFRTAIAQAVNDIDIEGLAGEDLETAGVMVDLVVGEPVPAWAMQDPPGALLTRLPSLPSAIEYRLVGDALILWDVHAEILIDALPR